MVENYQTSVPAGAVDQIGAETSANSIDAVALQVARTARTTPPPAIATIVMQANHAIRAGADTAQLATPAGQRHVVAMPGTNAGVVSLGCDTIDGGAGSDTVWAGAGAISVHGGTGNLTVHGGGGVANISLKSGTSDLVMLGSGGGVVFMGGTDTVSAGSGSDIFQFTHGTGGHDVIQGFVPGRDTITLLNYTAATPAAALSGARDTATGTILTFGDGTTVTLSGLHHVTASLFG